MLSFKLGYAVPVMLYSKVLCTYVLLIGVILHLDTVSATNRPSLVYRNELAYSSFYPYKRKVKYYFSHIILLN